MILTPTIHRNGSHGPTLQEEYMQAHVAATNLLDALQGIELHGRDYYVQPAGAFEKACDEHRARFAAVLMIRAELDQIILAIQQQVKP